MERDFLGAIGHEQLLQQRQRAAAEDDATRKESGMLLTALPFLDLGVFSVTNLGIARVGGHGHALARR